MAIFCITHGSKPNDEHQQLDIKKEAKSVFCQFCLQFPHALRSFDWHETDELSFDLMKIVYGSTVKVSIIALCPLHIIFYVVTAPSIWKILICE